MASRKEESGPERIAGHKVSVNRDEDLFTGITIDEEKLIRLVANALFGLSKEDRDASSGYTPTAASEERSAAEPVGQGAAGIAVRQDTNNPQTHYQGISKVSNRITEPVLMSGATAEVGVGGKNERDITTSLILSYDSEDVRLSKPLTPLDREVHNAVATLWAAGNRTITPLQVYRTMTGKSGKPRPGALADIVESIDKQRRTFVKLYFGEEMRGRSVTFEGEEFTPKECRIETYMLDADKVTVVATNGRELDGYSINRAPVLYQHDSMTKQVVSYPQRLLEATSSVASMTGRNVLIRSYLIKRIEMMRPGRSMKSHHVQYDTILSEIGLGSATRTERSRVVQTVKRLLDAFTAAGFIAGWSEYRDTGSSHRLLGVCIDLADGKK